MGIKVKAVKDIKPSTILAFRHSILGELTVVVGSDKTLWFIAEEIASKTGAEDIDSLVKAHAKNRVQTRIPYIKGNDLITLISYESFHDLLYQVGFSEESVLDYTEWVDGHIFPSVKEGAEYEFRGVKVFVHPVFGELSVILDADRKFRFVGRQVAEKLGYASSAKRKKQKSDSLLYAINKLCEDREFVASEYFKVNDIPSPFGEREVLLVSESDLYSLVIDSRVKWARDFGRWITKEVLPSIRKTEIFGDIALLPNFTSPAEAARAWAEEYEERVTAEEKLKEAFSVPEHELPFRLHEIIDRWCRENEEIKPMGWTRLYKAFNDSYGINLVARKTRAEKRGEPVKSLSVIQYVLRKYPHYAQNLLKLAEEVFRA